MFVSVMYYHPAENCYSGGLYTYETNMKLHLGDNVKAKTKRGGEVTYTKAKVMSLNVEKPAFPCHEITELWTEEAAAQ